MPETRHVDLCIIGSGSANSIPDERFDDWSIALVEGGTFGGTCLNVGCIPTKMYVHPADLARTPEHAGPLGVDLTLDRVRWGEIRDRIFGRIDPISAAGERYRAESRNISLFRQHGRFVSDGRLRLDDGTEITADRFVIAAGSRVRIPTIDGLADTPYETSDTVMRLPELPRSMIIVGAGYVAAEFAHVFSAYGTAVTLIGRGDALLRHEDGEISSRFTRALSERVDLRLEQTVSAPRRTETGGVALDLEGPGGSTTVTAEVLLLATGRIPNGDGLDVDRTGVALDDDGYVVVDAFQRTNRPGIFALGDVSSHHQLKHVANHEARVVQHNLLHPDAMIAADHRFVPHAVFSSPQVASVGLTEEEAFETGVAYVVGQTEYASTAYGWAMGETGDHLVKLLADPSTGLLLGAHLIGPEASSLIQPLIQAMSFGQRADEVARGQYWIHPAMAEVVENALLDLPLDPLPHPMKARLHVVLAGCLVVTAACGTVPPVASPSLDSASPAVSASPAPVSPSTVSTPSAASSTLRSAPSATPSSARTPTPGPQPVRCAALASSLSLRDQVGQLMMVAVSSDGVGSAAATAIDESRAGSVILLGNTTAGASRVNVVVEQARRAARTPKDIATMVAADQEGGQVQRLRGEGFDRIPSAQRQAPAELKSDAARWGRQLRRVGIDANLAPVADVVPKGREDTNEPIGVLRRGYGANPDTVARHVTAFTEGMDAAGVATSVKHFPGLGKVRGNTDLTAEVVDTSTTRRDQDLKPFAAGVDAGTDMVMMSSAYYAEIDASRRAAFSPTVIKGMVRGDLGFTGVVISDDLAAAAMRDLSPGQRMLRFLRAGGDLAIVGDPSMAARMADAVVDEAREDPKLAAAVEASTVRVLQLKDRRGLTDC